MSHTQSITSNPRQFDSWKRQLAGLVLSALLPSTKSQPVDPFDAANQYLGLNLGDWVRQGMNQQAAEAPTSLVTGITCEPGEGDNTRKPYLRLTLEAVSCPELWQLSPTDVTQSLTNTGAFFTDGHPIGGFFGPPTIDLMAPQHTPGTSPAFDFCDPNATANMARYTLYIVGADLYSSESSSIQRWSTQGPSDPACAVPEPADEWGTGDTYDSAGDYYLTKPEFILVDRNGMVCFNGNTYPYQFQDDYARIVNEQKDHSLCNIYMDYATESGCNELAPCPAEAAVTTNTDELAELLEELEDHSANAPAEKSDNTSNVSMPQVQPASQLASASAEKSDNTSNVSTPQVQPDSQLASASSEKSDNTTNISTPQVQPASQLVSTSSSSTIDKSTPSADKKDSPESTEESPNYRWGVGFGVTVGVAGLAYRYSNIFTNLSSLSFRSLKERCSRRRYSLLPTDEPNSFELENPDEPTRFEQENPDEPTRFEQENPLNHSQQQA